MKTILFVDRLHKIRVKQGLNQFLLKKVALALPALSRILNCADVHMPRRTILHPLQSN